MMGETQRLVARITQAEADRNETAGQLAALQAQLAAEQAAKAELQASLKADAARLGRQVMQLRDPDLASVHPGACSSRGLHWLVCLNPTLSTLGA